MQVQIAPLRPLQMIIKDEARTTVWCTDMDFRRSSPSVADSRSNFDRCAVHVHLTSFKAGQPVKNCLPPTLFITNVGKNFDFKSPNYSSTGHGS